MEETINVYNDEKYNNLYACHDAEWLNSVTSKHVSYQYATPETLQSKFLVQLNNCWQSTLTLAARRPMLFGITDMKFFVGLRSTDQQHSPLHSYAPKLNMVINNCSVQFDQWSVVTGQWSVVSPAYNMPRQIWHSHVDYSSKFLSILFIAVDTCEHVCCCNAFGRLERVSAMAVNAVVI